MFTIEFYLSLLVLSFLFARLIILLPYAQEPQKKRCRRKIFSILYRLSKYPLLAYALVFFVSIFINSTFAIIHFPEPTVHDEFAYIQAADTYASGKLTNTTHPFWKHFETFHTLSQPTTIAKYPAGNGLLLALGKVLFKNTLVGSWIGVSTSLCVLLWMLRAWMPFRWALCGVLVLSLHVPLYVAWGQTWWGGSVQFIGGCLLFGAMKRLLKKTTLLNALAYSIGTVFLMHSRPFEGAIAWILATGTLIYSLRSRESPLFAIKALQHAFIAMGVIGVGVLFHGYNNHAVTGSYFTLPYQAHSKQYSATSMFLWSQLPEIPDYNHKKFFDYHVLKSRERSLSSRKISNYIMLLFRKLKRTWWFCTLAGGLSFYPVFSGMMRISQPWILYSVFSVLLLISIHLMTVFGNVFPHYIAPVLCLWFYVQFTSIRYLFLASFSRNNSRVILYTILIFMCMSINISFLFRYALIGKVSPRQSVALRLQKIPGKHVVFVKYNENHKVFNEWVYNRASIDNAPIVWANFLDRSENSALIQYYRERTAWVVEADEIPLKLYQYKKDSDL